jgi:hypothetical protein
VPIPVIDTTEFRRRVAGLIDPNRKTGAAEEKNVKEEAKQLCLILCELFGESLDRLTLWDRIASALSTSAAKCDDGDTDRFVSLCLEHVKADQASAARHQEFASWVMTMAERDDAYRQAFVRHVGQKTAIVLVHGRFAWEERKKMRQIQKGGDQ